MTLKQLEYAIMVAKTGSFNKASENLYIAQPSLTHAIQELEKEMGITIFERNNKGITVTREGEEFLAYARQVKEQSDLLEEKYKKNGLHRPSFTVSCQHYSFCVTAFAEIVKKYGIDKYDFTLRETETHEIFEDVTSLKSEIGVIYLASKNREVLTKLIKKNELEFIPLFKAKPHVFMDKNNPLASKEIITIKDLEPYPYLTYEQGEYNSFYYSEEFIPSIDMEKNILVRDRATLFNLCHTLNGYTVSSGIIGGDVNEGNIIAKPLKYNEEMEIGYIKLKNVSLSEYALSYVDYIKNNFKAN